MVTIADVAQEGGVSVATVADAARQRQRSTRAPAPAFWPPPTS